MHYTVMFEIYYIPHVSRATSKTDAVLGSFVLGGTIFGPEVRNIELCTYCKQEAHDNS